MLKKYSRIIILAFLQGIALICLVSWLSNYLANNEALLTSVKHLVRDAHMISAIVRYALYLCLFFAWTPLVKSISSKELSDSQLKVLTKGKYVFMIALFMIESLYWLGKI